MTICDVHLSQTLSQPPCNEWYPRGLQISLHTRSPGLQDYSKVWNLKLFAGGGYSETLGFGLCDNFHFGGVFWNSRIWTLWQFSLGEVFWNSQIWTLWQFSLGGYSETLGFGLSDNFHFGGYSEHQNRGYSEDFGPKFQPLQQAHASQIVSHILRIWRLIMNSNTWFPRVYYRTLYIAITQGN